MPEPPIYLIFDAHYLCWKAYFTMGDLSYAGTPTGVLVGFLNQVKRIAEEFRPCSLVFAWDSCAGVRREEFPDYKKRDKDLTEEEEQDRQIAMEQVKDLRRWALPKMGIHQNYILTGFEADDVIAQFVMIPKELSKTVVTGDDDLLQLLRWCSIYYPNKSKVINQTIFRKNYGIEPNRWADVKAIAGCPGDGVPGVPKVGEKTALSFVRGELGEHTASYKRIQENAENIRFYRRLVELPHSKCPELIEKEANSFDASGYKEVCDEYGLESFKDEQVMDNWGRIING